LTEIKLDMLRCGARPRISPIDDRRWLLWIPADSMEVSLYLSPAAVSEIARRLDAYRAAADLARRAG
jgi:hypothetical protein